VGCSRLFTRITLKGWGLEAVADTAELLMSELVANVVKLTGVMEPSPKWTELTDLALLHARLAQLEDGLILEVADRDSTLPTMPEQSSPTSWSPRAGRWTRSTPSPTPTPVATAASALTTTSSGSCPSPRP